MARGTQQKRNFFNSLFNPAESREFKGGYLVWSNDLSKGKDDNIPYNPPHVSLEIVCFFGSLTTAMVFSAHLIELEVYFRYREWFIALPTLTPWHSVFGDFFKSTKDQTERKPGLVGIVYTLKRQDDFPKVWKIMENHWSPNTIMMRGMCAFLWGGVVWGSGKSLSGNKPASEISQSEALRRRRRMQQTLNNFQLCKNGCSRLNNFQTDAADSLDLKIEHIWRPIHWKPTLTDIMAFTDLI